MLGLNGQDAATTAMEQYQTSPGYDFQMQQGLRAVDAGAAAKGMLRSGATLKAERTFGQGLADQDFSAYYGRLNQLSTSGQNASVGAGTNAMNTANNSAQTDASLATTQGNLTTGLASGLGTAANQYMSNSMYQDRTNALASPQVAAAPNSQQYYQNAPVSGW